MTKYIIIGLILAYFLYTIISSNIKEGEDYEELLRLQRDETYNKVYRYFKNTAEGFQDIDIDWKDKIVTLYYDDQDGEPDSIDYNLVDLLKQINHKNQ